MLAIGNEDLAKKYESYKESLIEKVAEMSEKTKKSI
jgi:phosphoribosylcarboxyaminoimidazole (NCAIR) mutase